MSCQFVHESVRQYISYWNRYISRAINIDGISFFVALGKLRASRELLDDISEMTSPEEKELPSRRLNIRSTSSSRTRIDVTHILPAI